MPFPQEHPTERMFAILMKDFEALPDYIPNELKQIISKALAKSSANRYVSADEMCNELKEVSTFSKLKSKPLVNSVPEAKLKIDKNTIADTHPNVPLEKTQPSHVARQKTMKAILSSSPSFKNETSEKPKKTWLYFSIFLLIVSVFGLFVIIKTYYWANSDKKTEARNIENAKNNDQIKNQSDVPLNITYKSEMVLVPAGEFTMGSDAAMMYQSPRIKLMSAFYIDKYEVTNAQYKEFCDATQRSYPNNP